MGIISTYNGLQTVAGLEDVVEFPSVESWLQNNGSQGFQVIEGGKGLINGTGGTTYTKVVNINEGLTGGNEVGATATSVTATAGGVTATSVGAYASVSLLEVLGGIFAGLGIGVVSYEANKDFWIDISNQAFQNFPGYEPITYDNIDDMSILTLISDNSAYVPYDIVNEVSTALINANANKFEQYITVTDTFNVGDSFEPNFASFDENFIRTAISQFYSKGRYAGIRQLDNYIDMIMTIFNNQIPFNIYNTYAINIYYNWAGIYPITTSISIRYGNTSLEKISQKLTNIKSEIYYEYIPISYENGFEYSLTLTNEEQIFIGSRSSDVFVSGVIGNRYSVNSDFNIISAYSTSNVNTKNNIIKNPATTEPTGIPIELPNNIPVEFPDWYSRIKELEVVNPNFDPASPVDPATNPLSIPTPLLPIELPFTSPQYVPNNTPQREVQTTPNIDTDNPPSSLDDDPQDSIFDKDKGKVSDTSTPSTPTPNIPVVPAIGGDANALFTVYNPTKAQLNSLGGVLWTNNIITQIIEMFTNNPLDAIISLHILYATPSTGNNAQIKLGYVPTGVYSPLVTNQYVHINCGTVRVAEYFGDVRDYDNTSVSIYLPFIGIRDLHTQDIIASEVTVEYRVDVYTGVVLCTVTVAKTGISQVLYTFEGNCSVSLPLTGADKSRMISSAVGFIGGMGMAGMATTAMSQAGATLGAVKNVTGGPMISINRSGNFTGNAGAMGCKIPYIIINRKVPYDATNYQKLYGYPANYTVYLNECKGYTRVKEIHVDDVGNATIEEKAEIETLLKNGVIIS